MSRTILHATDFSSASKPALAKAIELARRERAPLVIAHVMTPVLLMMGDGYVAPATWDEIYRSYRESSQKKLDAVVAKVRAAGVHTRGLLLDGLAHQQILRAAKKLKAGFIVVGTHGRTGVARFVLGSVAGRVVGGAQCPVVTVRGK